MARLPDLEAVDHPQSVADANLRVALDNMPGALAYTDDDLRIVFCNDRFKEMYVVPQERSDSHLPANLLEDGDANRRGAGRRAVAQRLSPSGSGLQRSGHPCNVATQHAK
jgi:PAS domain-containing protein